MIISVTQAQSVITGTVTDVKTGEALIGCNVYLKNTTIGTVTNAEGNYVLQNVPPGTHILIASYLGFEEKGIEIGFEEKETKNIDFKLQYSGGIDLDEVTITVQAKGQIAAINQQLASKEIKNVVSKERIRELPDANAAEAVGRLPGVSLQREGGEGNKIVVRGMSPRYNKILIEGVEMAATSSGDRSTDISMISPYSLDGIELTKAITPDKDGDFIGGMVNFRLQKAEEGFHTSFVVQGNFNQVHNAFNNYNVVGGVSNRFFNDKLGMFLQVNAESRNRSSNNMSAGYYLVGPSQKEWDPVHTSNVALTNVFRNKKRYGGTFVMDYTIPYGKIMFSNIYSMGNAQAQYYTENYSVTDRTYYTSTGEDENSITILSNILSFEQKFPKISLDGRISHSYSSNHTPYSASYSFNQPSVLSTIPDNINLLPEDIPPYSIDPATNKSRIDYTKSIMQRADYNEVDTKDRRIEASANMEWFFNITEKMGGSLKFGGKYRYITRSFDQESFGGLMNLGSGRAAKDALLEAIGKTDDVGSMNYIPFSYFENSAFNHHEFLNGKYTMGSVVDAGLMRNSILAMNKVDAPVDMTYGYTPYASTSYDYSGNENLYAGYLMAYLNFTKMVEFIPGFRYEYNNTGYAGARGRSPGVENANYNAKDTTTVRNVGSFLPMIHLLIKPTKWFSFHLAYTHSLSRANFNILIPRRDIGLHNVEQNFFNVLPEKSENWDLYLTFHQSKLGLFTAGGFTKRINDKIFWTDSRVILDPSDYDLPPDTKYRKIVTQENLKEPVYVKGFEFDWQSNFWYLPGILKGLVLNANYTHIYSEAKYPKTTIHSYYDSDFNLIQENIDTFYVDRMIDQPNDIVNLSMGFDYKNFSIRISMLYKADVFTAPDFNPELSSYTDDYLRWDLSSSYQLPWVKGLQVFLNITNLNAAKDVVLIKGNGFQSSVEHYGRVVDFGIRWRL
jgi:TonB-dependent receptor